MEQADSAVAVAGSKEVTAGPESSTSSNDMTVTQLLRQQKQLVNRLHDLQQENDKLRHANRSGHFFTEEQRRHLKEFLGSRVDDILGASMSSLERAASGAEKTAMSHVQLLSDALTKECHKTADLDARLRQVEEEKVLALQREAQQLREVIAERDRTIAKLQGAEDVKLTRLEDRIRELGEENSTLRSELKGLLDAAACSETRVSEVVEVHAAFAEAEALRVAQIADLEQQIAKQQDEAQASLAVAEARRESEARRAQQEFQAKLLVAEEKHEALETRVATLLDERATLRKKFEEAAAEQDSVISQLRQKLEELCEVEEQFNKRRHREEQFECSTRDELLQFWIEGRDRIRDLQLQLDDATARAAKLAETQQQLRFLEGARSGLIASLAQLTSEVQTLRGDVAHLREQLIGREAENDLLAQHLCELLEGRFTDGELEQCREAVRVAAARAAAASGALVVDEEALEARMCELLALQREVGKLSTRRDELQKVVSARERRIAQLNTIVATHLLPHTDPTAPSGGSKDAEGCVSAVVSGSMAGVIKGVLREAPPVDEDERVRKQKRLELLADVKTSRERAMASEATVQQLHQRITELEAELESVTTTGDTLRTAHAEELEVVARRNAQLTHELSSSERRLQEAENAVRTQRSALISTQGLCCHLLKNESEHLSLIASLLAQLASLREALEAQQLCADVESRLLDSMGAEGAFSSVVTALQHHLDTVSMHLEWRARSADERETAGFALLAKAVDEYRHSAGELKNVFAHATKEQLDRLLAAAAEEHRAWEIRFEQQLAAFEQQRAAAEQRQRKATKYWDDAVVRALVESKSAAVSAAEPSSGADPQSSPPPTSAASTQGSDGAGLTAALATISASMQSLSQAATTLTAASRQSRTAPDSNPGGPSFTHFASGGLLDGVE